jgi:rubrerythrin
MTSNDVFERYQVIDGQELKISLYYSLGGWNNFTGEKEPRGYYFSVSPVTVDRREDGSISSTAFTIFSGTKKLLLETKRKSDKAAKQAEDMVPEWEQTLIDHVMKKVYAERSKAAVAIAVKDSNEYKLYEGEIFCTDCNKVFIQRWLTPEPQCPNCGAKGVPQRPS